MRDHSTKTTDVKCVLKMKFLKYFLNMLVTLNKQIKEFCELLGNQFNFSNTYSLLFSKSISPSFQIKTSADQ